MAYAEIDLDEYEDDVLRDASTGALEAELDRRAQRLIARGGQTEPDGEDTQLAQMLRENTSLKVENAILKQRMGRFDCNINLKVVNK